MRLDEWPEALQTAWKDFEGVVIEAGRTLLGHMPPTLKAQVTTLDEVEAVTRQITQTVGNTVAQAWTREIVQTLEPPTPPSCPVCAMAMRKIGRRPLAKLGLFGEYQWSRAYYVCPRGHGGTAPLDAILALGPERFTATLAEAVTAFAVNLPFDQIPPLMNTLVDVPLDGDTIRRVAERVGGVAEAAEQGAITAVTADMAGAAEEPPPGPEDRPASAGDDGDRPPSLAPDALIVSVDGVMAPFKAGHAYHEVKVGVCVPLQRVSTTPSASKTPAWQPLQAADYCLGLEARPEFWRRVRAHALDLGLDAASCQLVVLLGDGADWIWRYGAHYLGGPGRQIVESVDIFHARGHLWDYAKAYFANEADVTAWATPFNEQLETEGPGPIMAAMTALEAKYPGDDPKTVEKEHHYFVNHAAQMDYPRYRAMGLPIGSGIVEGACKTLVKERLDGGGMWWTEAGAQTLGTLRALYRSGLGRWRQFWADRPYAAPRHRSGPDPKSLSESPAQVA